MTLDIEVEIEWDEVDDANRYDIYREGSHIGETSDTSYIDDEVPEQYEDETITYEIVAVMVRSNQRNVESAPQTVQVDLELGFGQINVGGEIFDINELHARTDGELKDIVSAKLRIGESVIDLW